MNKNGYDTSEKAHKVLDIFMPLELRKLVRYSTKKAYEISRYSDNGICLLYVPNYSHLASYVDVALHGMGKEDVQILPLDADLKRLGISKKYTSGKDLFAFGSFGKEEKEKLKRIIHQGVEMVKRGGIKSFNFSNVNTRKRREIKEVNYIIEPDRLRKAGKL